jgi:hypothetical protein
MEEFTMKSWVRMTVLCFGLILLGSPAVHVCRLVWGGATLTMTEASAQANNAPSLMWEDLQQLDLNTGKMPPSLKKLDGTIVRVPGFVIPLEDSDNSVSEFLLVPYPMACIHVPAPPPNLIVHVKMDRGKKIDFNFYNPIWMQGRLKIQRTQSVYTESSYFMTGLLAEPYRAERKAP